MKISRISAGVAALAAGALLLTGCSNPMDTSGGGEKKDGSAPLVISSANFIESETLGNVFAEALAANGIAVETKLNIGSRETYIPALTDGSIDLIPEYTGNLLLYLDPAADVSPEGDVEGELNRLLPEKGLTMLEPAPAEDTDTVTVSRETADKWNLKSIADLAAHNDELILGGMPEFNERDRGIPGLTELYGVVPHEFVAISDGGGPATVQAILDGTVHGANIFTTSPSIAENDLVVLEDPKGNFPQQHVLPLINTDSLTPEIEEVLGEVTSQLTTEELLKLNVWVSGDEKLEPKEAAQKWLKEVGII